VAPIIDSVLRAGEGRILRKLKRIAGQINSIEAEFADMSEIELRSMTDEFRQRYTDGETLDDLLPEAFAAVREAAKRTLGQRAFDVQLMGAAALHMGNIAEMKTGEGKTLTGVFPAYLNALAGNGVHVVTVNDYLAKRDSEWMGRVHRYLGLEVGVILAQMTPAERKTQYAADVTYGTNNEFGFDYLRDNMAWKLEDCVQRGHRYAIVDEVDSILIDEARTPLIISGPAEQSARWYGPFADMAPKLRRAADREPPSFADHVEQDAECWCGSRPGESCGDYEVDEKKKTIAILESGVKKVEDEFGIKNLYDPVNTHLVSFLNNSIKAKELFKRDKDYVVMNGEVLIVDEFTGRILHGRRYNEGMHQAIEAKEGVPIKDENQTLATITLQNYFRLYEKLAGMTGTAMTEANEFHQIYKLGVVPIPTNMPMIRADQADIIYQTEQVKFDACVKDIAERHEAGQPVLVGTTSVEKSETLSKLLRLQGVRHEVLNAKYHEREAMIIAQAGRRGAVTVATNMAGRGTDIMLGGNPEFIANQELLQQKLSPVETPDEYEGAWPAAVAKAQLAVAEEHEQVVAAGGLYVLGTERHESRRIDNQLRGRSGRQGDPGESRFYLSLEDDLMRRFNAERVAAIMDRLNVPAETPVESKVVSRAIQSAQSQVEQQNFEIRKDVLKYDDVLNRQRQVIYGERREVLEGADLHEQIDGMIDEVIREYVAGATGEGYPEEWDLDKLWKAFRELFGISISVDDVVEEAGGDRAGLSGELIGDMAIENAHAVYKQREDKFGTERMRDLERAVVLAVLDRRWREHLYEMDYLREGIGLRSYGQRDPLIEYQREGYDMFTAMMDGIKEDSVGSLFNVQPDFQENPIVAEAPADGAPVADAADGVAAGGPAATGSADQGLTRAPGAPAPGGSNDGPPRAGDNAGARTQPRSRRRPAQASQGTRSGGAHAKPAQSQSSASAVPPGLAPRRPQQQQQYQYSAPSIDGGAHVEINRGPGASDEWAHVGPNKPCPCGSGRKFKRCHGDPRLRPNV